MDTAHRSQDLWSDPDLSVASRKPDANRDLHNGFLAAGLPAGDFDVKLQMFYMGSAIMAGAVGGIRIRLVILRTRGLPGVIALVLVF